MNSFEQPKVEIERSLDELDCFDKGAAIKYESSTVEQSRIKRERVNGLDSLDSTNSCGSKQILEDVDIKKELLSEEYHVPFKDEIAEDISNPTEQCDGEQSVTSLQNLITQDTIKRMQNYFTLNKDFLMTTSRKCEICSKEFSQQSDLTVHMLSHIKEKPFKCEMCFKKFTQKSEIIVHMRYHTGEKPFKCEVCLKKFAQNSELTIHMRVHTGDKPFKCEICLKRFSQKHSLTNHMLSHSGDKPFKCEICLKQFRQKHHLVSHVHCHTDEKLFQCETCLKQFSWKSSFTRHMRCHI